MEKGTKVRMTTGQMGLMSSPDGSRFVSEVLCFGDEAVYDGPHPNESLAEKGWVLLTVNMGGRTLWCPAHDSQFDAESVAFRLAAGRSKRDQPTMQPIVTQL